MKSARERAEEVFASLPGTAQLAIKYDGLGKAWIPKIELMFKEHARDQRHLCAEAVVGALVNFRHRSDAHAAAMNTPAPGE